MLAVAERELRSAFRSPIAYAVMGVYLALHGLLFAQLMEDYSVRSLRMLSTGGVEDVQNLVDMVARPLIMGDAFLLLLLLPALTMRQISDEWRQGTSDLLLSYPLREVDIVLGKFFASAVVVAMLVLLGGLYVASTAFLGRLEVGVVLMGWLGLYLYSLALVAVGLLYSALTESQVIAFVATLVTLFGITLLGAWGPRVGEPWSHVLEHLSLTAHVDAFGLGVLRLTDAVFFLSLGGLFLYLTVGVLEAKRWRSMGRA